MDETQLQIIISAVDEASEAIGEVGESMSTLSEAASSAVSAVDAEFAEMQENIAATGTAIGLSYSQMAEMLEQDNAEIQQTMIDTGATADEAAATIEEANAAIAASGEETAADLTASSDISKGSFMAVGVAAGLAFTGVESAVSSSISSAEQWDETSAVISNNLKNIGSNIPLSQIQSYAQQIQSTTLFSQQQALSAEAIVTGYKNLAPQYQTITGLSADLATKIQQFTGSATADMPNAMKILTNALNDPVAGINQLIRQAGVDLPAATVTMIENMAKVGNTSGADALLIKAVSDQVGGMAQAVAGAPGAALTQLQNKMGALGTQVGNDLLPDLDKLAQALIPVITAITNWAEEHPKLTEAIVIGTVAFTAFLAVASIIAIIVAAVGSSVALAMVVISGAIAVFLAWALPNWKTFWNDFQTVTQVAAQILADIIEFALNLIMAAVYVFQEIVTGTFKLIWDIISGVATDEWNAIISVLTVGFKLGEALFTAAKTYLPEIWSDTWNTISNIVTNIWNTITNTVKAGVDSVISAINAFINALDAIHISIPSISIPGTKLATPAVNLGFSIPDIPMLAEGGFVTQPTLALIGESGPEAVIPLSGSGAAGGQQIVVNINGGIFPADQSSIRQIANMIAAQINRGLKVANYAL